MKRSRRLNQDEIATIRETIVRVQALHDYAPVKSAYSASALQAVGDAMENAQEAVFVAEQALAAARDAATIAEWAAYDVVRGVKAQVVAQYGDDSPAMQAVGLKKKSDYKRTPRRAAATEPKATTADSPKE